MKKLIKVRDKILIDLFPGNFIFVSCVLGIFIGLSCSRPGDTKSTVAAIPNTPTNNSVKVITTIPPNCCGNPTDTVYLYIMDGCEYIGSVNKPAQGDWLTHKGNCKNHNSGKHDDE